MSFYTRFFFYAALFWNLTPAYKTGGLYINKIYLIYKIFIFIEPSKPLNLQAFPTEDFGLLVSWSPPEIRKTCVKYYKIVRDAFFADYRDYDNRTATNTSI